MLIFFLKLSFVNPETDCRFQVQRFLLKLLPRNFYILVFLAHLSQFLLVLCKFLGILVPFRAPLVPEGGNAVDEEGVEFLIGLLVDVGKLRDVASQDLQFLLNDFGLAAHGHDHLAETVDVAAHRQVHGHFLLLFRQHRRKQYNFNDDLNVNQSHRMLTRTKKLAYAATHIARICLPPSITPTYTHYPRFAFCEAKWSRNNFNSKLEKEISDLEGSIQPTDPEYEEYFKKHSWTIRYIPENVIFQFSKVDAQHEIKVLTTVKQTPPNTSEMFSEQDDNQAKNLNYSLAKIYLRKSGAEKWLAAESAIFDGSVELLTLSFTETEPSLSWQKTAYPGPELSTLPDEVINGIHMVFKQFGLTPEVLMNMVIHSSIKAEQLNVAWLKDLREVWA